MAEWHLQIKAGDSLSPIPLWNQTERPPNRLPSVTPVLEVVRATSQTGVLLRVKNLGGNDQWLDAGWFVEPAGQQQPSLF